MPTRRILLLPAICLLLALPVVLAGSPQSARESHHFVDALKGDDTAAGTLERPWRTLRASIPKLKPGDMLFLREGVFFEKEIRFLSKARPNDRSPFETIPASSRHRGRVSRIPPTGQ
jgi:hypothetical protein